MIDPPRYFEAVRKRAAGRWDQLEQDPVLAGPWHQLFKQVQSPRHVISELLQNADDAGASSASVEIEGDDFVFKHDGEDFTEEHFDSLCRFGYSNKRALHTIGFRGVGFKSTFSIGDVVTLTTPTLSVAFGRDRFTEPIWRMQNGTGRTSTEIRVGIRDNYRLLELQKNLDDWKKSPSSLLFFRSIRSLDVAGETIQWQSQSEGPVVNSEWVALLGDETKRFLLIQSFPVDFPVEALEEIRQERLISMDEECSFPPCRVELVLGMEGRLFVILPTGVKTRLPFACNAPFVQDPARVKIKDPEISPTNRWLLQRIGTLAATSMTEWLENSKLDVELRCKSYSLFPDVDSDDHSIEGSCGHIVQEAFANSLADQAFLLSESGTLERKRCCIAVPNTLLDVWSANQVQQLLGKSALPILSQHVRPHDRQKLVNWDCLEEVDKESILDSLESAHLPKPDTWMQLLLLWDYIADNVVGYHYRHDHKNVAVVPVQGKDVLFSASEVVRLGEKKLLRSDEDWQFLTDYLLVLNQNWTRFLADRRRTAEQDDSQELGRQVESAYKVLNAIGLDQSSDVSQVIQQVSSKFFQNEDCDIEDCIRLAQLAATLNASISDDFEFITQDGYRREASEHIIYDAFNDLDRFVDEEWYSQHALHKDYRVFLSCGEAEWEQWARSDRSKLATFIPLSGVRRSIWGRNKLSQILRERGYGSEPYYPYVTNQFILLDWDFDESYWDHWHKKAVDDDEFWGILLSRLFEQPPSYWKEASTARVTQVATTGNSRTITSDGFIPSWILRFRELPCLQDTRGSFRLPAELLRRTPETESLLDVEPFVRAELDTEVTRNLLILLGVGDTPTGPDRLLDRLSALATVDNPPVYEVEKWYHRLDQLFDRCSTDETQQIISAFNENKIILTEQNEWASAGEVFVNSDEEDVPGAALVHPSCRNLALWHKVGVADRPTADLAIEWLKNLGSGEPLAADELRRVRSLLPRYPERIWSECSHWLNLEGEWTQTDELPFALTMQSLVPWKHLFRPFKQKTADLQKLSEETCQKYPFSDLRRLAGSIEDRFQEQLFDLPAPQRKPWLYTLGAGLRRIALDDPEEQARIHGLADRLATSSWQVAPGIRTVPYIDSTPAGTPRRIDVLWKDDLVYVEDRSSAKMAKAVAQELGRVFNRQDIIDAIKICYDRPPEFVTEYLEENFTLLPEDQVQPIRETSSTGTNESTSDSGDQETSPVSAEEGVDASEQEDENDPDVENEQIDSNFDETETSLDDQDESAKPTRKPRKPSKPSLIERFARANGYKQDGDNRFYHDNGSWLARAGNTSFPWEHFDSSGVLIQCYWIKDHCIQTEPIQIHAEIWELCVKHPEKYTLIFADPDGVPVEYSGKRICELRDNGQLSLFPASYRLVYDERGSAKGESTQAKGTGENNE